MKKSKTVRLPDELIKKVQQAADKDGRTFSNKLIRILESWTEGQEKAA